MSGLPWLVLHGPAVWQGALLLTISSGAVLSCARARGDSRPRLFKAASGASMGVVAFAFIFVLAAAVARLFPSARSTRNASLLAATPFRRAEGLARVEIAIAARDRGDGIDIDAFEQRVALAMLRSDCLAATHLLLTRGKYGRAEATAEACASARWELAIAAFEMGDFTIASQAAAGLNRESESGEDRIFEIMIHLLAGRDDLAGRAADEAARPDRGQRGDTLSCLSDALHARHHDQAALRRLRTAESPDCRLLLADILEGEERTQLIETIAGGVPGSCKLPGFVRRKLQDLTGPRAPPLPSDGSRTLRDCQGYSSIHRAMAALWIEVDHERDTPISSDFDLPPLDFFLPASREDLDVYSTSLEEESLNTLARTAEPTQLLRRRRIDLATKRAVFESLLGARSAALRWADLATSDARTLAEGDAPATLQLEKPPRDAPGARSGLLHAVNATRAAILFDGGRLDEAKMIAKIEAPVVPGASDLLAWTMFADASSAAASSMDPLQKKGELTPTEFHQVRSSLAGESGGWGQSLWNGTSIFTPALRLLRPSNARTAGDESLRAWLAWGVVTPAPASVELRFVDVIGRLAAARVLGEEQDVNELTAVLTRFRTALARRPAVVPLLIVARAQAATSSRYPDNSASR